MPRRGYLFVEKNQIKYYCPIGATLNVALHTYGTLMILNGRSTNGLCLWHIFKFNYSAPKSKVFILELL
jgi:hypothetical protein